MAFEFLNKNNSLDSLSFGGLIFKRNFSMQNCLV